MGSEALNIVGNRDVSVTTRGGSEPRVGPLVLKRKLDRLAQGGVVGGRPSGHVDVGEQLCRLPEHGDAVADRDRLFELMRDQDGGGAALARQFEEGLAQ